MLLLPSTWGIGTHFDTQVAHGVSLSLINAERAHKLARLIYTVLTKGEEYTDQGQAYYEQRYRELVLRQFQQRAKKMG